MDAVKFLKEAHRMCDCYAENDCVGCPNRADQDECSCGIISIEDAAVNVNRVDKWSAEHTVKTRLDVFREMFPNALFVTQECPRNIEGGKCSDYAKSINCCKCYGDYWNSPAPEGFGKGGTK